MFIEDFLQATNIISWGYKYNTLAKSGYAKKLFSNVRSQFFG